MEFLKKYWAVYNLELMPADYRMGGKLGPYHIDWIKPFQWVARAWTMFWFPLPAIQLAGNAKMVPFPVREGYPVADGAEVIEINGKKYFMGPDPILPRGGWSIQAVKFPNCPPIPCYFTCTIPAFGKNWLISGILKPDPSDPNWGFPEISFRNKLIGGVDV